MLHKALRLGKNLANSIINNVGILIIIWDTEGNLLNFNKFSENATGFSEEEVNSAFLILCQGKIKSSTFINLTCHPGSPIMPF